MADYKKPDYWQLKAKKEGYPARSVYKLMEIDDKFSLLKIKRAHSTGDNSKNNPSFRVIDIGAAPGSWSLYILRKIAASSRAGGVSYIKNGFLAAVDLLPVSREYDNGLFDNGNFFFIQGDARAAEVREALGARGPYSLIISDAAPNTTGSHLIDCARSLELAETAVSYAENSLVSGGNLTLKIFQGSGTDLLLKKLKTLFETAKSFKPQACRDESVETYFIGLGKK